MSGSTRPCDLPFLPHGLVYARPYLPGWCCDRHTPAALVGRPEPLPGPGWPPGSYLNQLHTDPPAEQEQP